MQKGRGFTVVELVVVLAIMSILVVLVSVGLTASQKNGRDAKRKSDIEAIARGLEIRYRQGNPRAVNSGGATQPGSYPGLNEILHMQGSDRGGTWTPNVIPGGYLTEALPATTISNFTPPGGTTIGPHICVWACGQAERYAEVIEPATTMTRYYYEPIGVNGEVCANGGCVRFNLYYRNEDGVLQTVRSARQ